ncbi:MAG: hypothetical protein FWF06_06445 [Symbiobacteriaceae bacterium]|nr:hypothetical protein [Symbiobacteriaceae bacterium]
MPPTFPFLLETNGETVAPNVELALAFAIGMQRREEGTFPFRKRGEEAPATITRVNWPVLASRAYAPNRYLFADLTGLTGSRLHLPAPPEFTLNLAHIELKDGDSFNMDVLNLAQQYTSMIMPYLYQSSLMTLFAGMGELMPPPLVEATPTPPGTPLLEAEIFALEDRTLEEDAWYQVLHPLEVAISSQGVEMAVATPAPEAIIADTVAVAAPLPEEPLASPEPSLPLPTTQEVTPATHTPLTDPWGIPLVADEGSIYRIFAERDNLLSWFTHYNQEQVILDNQLKIIRDISSQRVEYYEMQKSKALQLLNQEIATLEPQVNQQLGDIKQQQAMVQVQKSSLQTRLAEMEEEITHHQVEVQRLGGKGVLADYYQERIRRTREEMRYLSEQQNQHEEALREEISARTLLVHRPLAILEQQKKQEDRKWQQKINTERELLRALTGILQNARSNLAASAQILVGQSQVVKGEHPPELFLELPLIIISLPGSSGVRYLVIPPQTLRPASQIASFIGDLVRGVNLPLVSRGAAWDELAKYIEERLTKELPQDFTQRLKEGNLLAEDTCWQEITAGIGELRNSNAISERTAELLLAQVAAVAASG